jgi:hypothetical protein
MLLGAFSVPVLVIRIRDSSKLPLLYIRDYRLSDRVLYLVQKLIVVVSPQDSNFVSRLAFPLGNNLLSILGLEAYACGDDI